jgi:hypothetical protein
VDAIEAGLKDYPIVAVLVGQDLSDDIARFVPVVRILACSAHNDLFARLRRVSWSFGIADHVSSAVHVGLEHATSNRVSTVIAALEGRSRATPDDQRHNQRAST